jgi:hypothetical protein
MIRGKASRWIRIPSIGAGISSLAVIAPSSLAFLLLGLAGRDVVIRGQMTCPSPSAVAERLLPLLGEGSSPLSGVSIELIVIGGHLPGSPRRVSARITRDDGTVGLLRSIPLSASCEDAANEIAVSLAADWGTRLHTPPVENLLLPGEPRTAGGSAAPAGSRVAVDATTVARSASPRLEPVVRPVLARDAPGSPWNGTLGLAMGALRGGESGPTMQGSVDATLLFSARWLARAVGSASGERQLAVASGHALWRRIGLSLGGGRRWQVLRRTGALLHLDATMGFMAAYSPVRGVGFLDDHATGSVDLGVVPAARLGWEARRLPLDIWAELGANLWATEHQVTVGGVDGSRLLPRLEGFATLGASYRFGH